MTASIQDSFFHALPAPKSRTRRSRAQKRSLVEQFNAVASPRQHSANGTGSPPVVSAAGREH